MQICPNRTVVRGEVVSVLADPSGSGLQVRLRVDQNESPVHDQDFLRPAAGSVLDLFAYDLTPELHTGDVIRAELGLNAGPTGERVILREVECIQ